MNYKSLFTTILIFTATLVNAQIDAKSKEILSKAASKNKSYTTILATFKVTVENKQNNTLETNDGSIEIKGDKYHIKMVNTESFFDGKTVWSLNQDAGEVNVTEPDPNDENALNPAKIFAIYEKGFKTQYIGESKIGNKSVSEIHLFPEAHNKPYSRIKLFIDNESSNVLKLEQIGKDGNNVAIEMQKFEVNKPIPDSQFIFDTAKHPNIEVIDLR